MPPIWPRPSGDGSGPSRGLPPPHPPNRRFGVITQRAIRRGSFTSVKQLRDKINRFVDDHNSTTRPFVWTATADSIIAKVERLGTLISGTAH